MGPAAVPAAAAAAAAVPAAADGPGSSGGPSASVLRDSEAFVAVRVLLTAEQWLRRLLPVVHLLPAPAHPANARMSSAWGPPASTSSSVTGVTDENVPREVLLLTNLGLMLVNLSRALVLSGHADLLLCLDLHFPLELHLQG